MQPSDSDIILETLESAARVCEDPTNLIYHRLFRAHPEMEALFMLDTRDEAKGHMLFEVLECIIDFVGPRYTSEGLILTELINHQQIGVPADVFATFFITIRDTFRELLGNAWSTAYDNAWEQLLEELSAVIRSRK